ncbi:extracellular solute-binding protein [Paenibacillus doosanensis]|uniref:extracellular solute-binding protein n=1 Tax=Paenibacillus doosanensis TaxID=1229154 RepID=UPI00217FC64D|nr:extracellular solute-binding protein [Paenibacillus doosanensis]
MNRMKTLSTSFMAVVAFSSLLAGCSSGDQGAAKQPSAAGGDAGSVLNASGFPIVNSEVSMRVFGCKDPNQAAWKDVLVLKEYEKKSGIKMVYEETPTQGCAEKRNLLFASNELPDVFLRADLSNTDISKYGMQEQMLIPLEGLIDKYAPNLKKLFDQYPEAKKSVTATDGHIYSLPVLRLQAAGRGDKIWINQDWLTKLNLKEPTNIDELLTVLRAFRDQDPNGNGKKDEIPLGLRDPGMVFTTFAGSFGLDHQLGTNANIDGGKVKLWVGDDRYKELLMFLNKLYAEKLLYADFYSQDLPKWRSNLSQALYGMFFIYASDPFTKVENQFAGMAPVKGPHGDQMLSTGSPLASPIGTFAITNVNKNPEAAIRWVDYFYSEEGSRFFNYGVEGQTYSMQSGKPVLADSIKNDPRGMMAALGQVNLVPGGGFPTIIVDDIVLSERTKEVSAVSEPFTSKMMYGAPIFDQEATDTIVPIKADLDKFVQESAIKFILGEMSFDKWDEYTATLKKMKIDQLEQAYQKAFDAMNKS